MVSKTLLEVKKDDFLKLLARELLLYENSEIEEAVIHISKRIKISEEKVRSFINYLYRHKLLVKFSRGQRYSLTLDGVAFLINLAESCYFSQDLEGGKNEYRTG